MELFTKLPDELKGHMLSYALWNASPAQVELFKTLPPEIQGYVLARKYPRELEEDTYGKGCKLNSPKCVYKLCLVGFFRYPGCLEELPHYREHGMCSKCKQEEARQATRRKERLDGLARFQQAWRTHDQQGIAENRIWCTVDAMYDACESWENYFVQRNAPQYEETLEEERDRMDLEMFMRGL